MSEKARISSVLRLGVSMPALLFCSGMALAVHSEGTFGSGSPSLTQEADSLDTAAAHKNPSAPHHLAHRRKGMHIASHHPKNKHPATVVAEAGPVPDISAPTEASDEIAHAALGHAAFAGRKAAHTASHQHAHPHATLAAHKTAHAVSHPHAHLHAHAEHKTDKHHHQLAQKHTHEKIVSARAGDKAAPKPGLPPSPVLPPHFLTPLAHYEPSVHPAVAAVPQRPAATFSATPWVAHAMPLRVAPAKPVAKTYAAAPSGLSTLAPSAGRPAAPAAVAPVAVVSAPLPWLVQTQTHRTEPAALVTSVETPASAPAPLPWQVHTVVKAVDQETVAFKTLVAADNADAVGANSLGLMGHLGDQVQAVAQVQADTNSMAQESALNAASVAEVGAQEKSISLASNDPPANLNALSPAAGAPAYSAPAAPAPPVPLMISPPVLASPAPAQPKPQSDLPDEAPRGLSRQSRAIADSLPPEREARDVIKPPFKVDHFAKSAMEDELHEHKSIGISISVRRPKPNINHMLEEAYDALIVGNQEDAIALYKQVLADDPHNKLALFGLATTYHRAGQIALARPLYGRLLAIDPGNREGLNNFLVLLSDESPAAALTEMKKLEHTHPDFSPLPAQMAVIYEKMGKYDEAIARMKHAIDLSPENVKYRYDMAVMLDQSGDWGDAAVFYQQLLLAHDRGEKIPANPEEIQERLTFIRSNRPVAHNRPGPTALLESDNTGAAQNTDAMGGTHFVK